MMEMAITKFTYICALLQIAFASISIKVSF